MAALFARHRGDELVLAQVSYLALSPSFVGIRSMQDRFLEGLGIKVARTAPAKVMDAAYAAWSRFQQENPGERGGMSAFDSCTSGPLVVRAIEYIQANACRPGGIDQRDIAKHLGVSLRTLQVHFEESTFAGTILDEIQRVRLAKVCELLTKTKKPIAEITRLTGFRTHSCLKVAFRKRFGISMAAYRKARNDAAT